MAESILKKAFGLVHGDRGVDYGHPLDDFTCTAEIITAILKHKGKLVPGAEVVAEDIPLFMQAVKISRECNAPKQDNAVDGAGYWETLEMVKDERHRRDLQADTFFQELKDLMAEEEEDFILGDEEDIFDPDFPYEMDTPINIDLDVVESGGKSAPILVVHEVTANPDVTIEVGDVYAQRNPAVVPTDGGAPARVVSMTEADQRAAVAS